MQGDALKEVLCIPYVLATKYQSYFDNIVWDEPFIIRNGFGKQFEVRVIVDKIAGSNYADIQISKIPTNNNGFTEVEAHIPYDHRLSYIVDLTQLRLVLTKYALLNTHIGFHLNVINGGSTLTSDATTTNTTLPATQALLPKLSSKKEKKKKSSIYYYDLESFDKLVYSIADDNLLVYDVILNNFREGSNIRRDNDLLMPIGQLKREGSSRISNIYARLHNAMPPPSSSSKSKLDLIPFDTKDREKAIAARIKQLGYNITYLKYKAQVGYYSSSSAHKSNSNSEEVTPSSTTDIQFPFLVEVVVIRTSDLPYALFYCEGINASPKHYYSFLQGDDLVWTSKGGRINVAYHIEQLLEKYGYSIQEDKSKKLRSIIMVNLWSPRIEYIDYGKSHIDLKPFSKTIVETLYKMCSGGSSVVGEGNTDSCKDDGGSDKQRAIEIFTDFLKKRHIQVLNNPRLKNTDRWNTSTPVYRIRPILEKNGLGHLTRKYLQGLVRTICNRLGVKREDVGIYEATRAQLYFKGGIYDVSLEQLAEIRKKGADILIIEKAGVVELLMPHADKYGFALCYTKGFLTDNAKKFCKLSSNAGGNIAILTDLDMSGLLIAGKVPDIPRIGITLETLQTLQIPISEVAEELTERNNKHSDAVKELYLDDYIAEKDWCFVNSSSKHGRRIEIDNVLAYVGAEKFWQDFVVKRFGELFPSRDYRRSINIPEYITPPILQGTIDSIHQKVKDFFKPECEKIMYKLKSYRGFIDDVPKEQEQMIEEMQVKLKEDKHLTNYLNELKTLQVKYGF